MRLLAEQGHFQRQQCWTITTRGQRDLPRTGGFEHQPFINRTAHPKGLSRLSIDRNQRRATAGCASDDTL